MAFGIDYNKASEGGLLPEGEYEVMVKYAAEDTTKGGTYHISIPMVVRNDLDQPQKNMHIWHKLWQKKTPTESDVQCGGFSAAQIQNMSKAAGLPNGKQYPDLAAWCNDLTGKLLRVTVKHEEWNGHANARVSYVNPSRHPACSHVSKSSNHAQPNIAVSSSNDFEELDDDGDLPF